MGNAIQNFTDPFTVKASKLVSLASGATMPPDIKKDVQRAERAGKEEKDLFIQDRLVEKKKSFYRVHPEFLEACDVSPEWVQATVLDDLGFLGKYKFRQER